MATAAVKYFSGTQLVQAYTVRNAEFDARFPGVQGRRSDSFSKWVGKNEAGEVLPVTRTIFFKKNASLHKCDSRCMNSKGHNCECSCGGKNHGAGG